MNIISTLLGSIGLIICLIGLFPLLGWISWVSLVLSIIGAVFGIFAERRSGLSLNLLVMLISMFRLMIGGGIF